MIKKVSALKELPTKIRKIVPKSDSVKDHAEQCDKVTKDKLSYIIHAEKHDTLDPFMTEHFDYLKYLGVKD